MATTKRKARPAAAPKTPVAVTPEAFLTVLAALYEAKCLNLDRILNEAVDSFANVAKSFGVPYYAARDTCDILADIDEGHAREWLAWLDREG